DDPVTGISVSSITGLQAGQTYYLRAYATNSAGTGYSDERFFSNANFGIPCPGEDTVHYFGKSYPTVQIGTQCWLKENLNVGTMINGQQQQTDNSVLEKFCYDNLELNCEIYGGLYQWNEAMQYQSNQDIQGICPAGWHVPSQYEFNTLIEYLGGDSVAGGKMKESGTGNWMPPNVGATNESGFSGLPGGSWSASHDWWYGTPFGMNPYEANFWSREKLIMLYYNSDDVYDWTAELNPALSVRCMKDDSLGLAYVTTSQVTDLGITTVIAGGDVDFSGGSAVTQRGVCYDTNSNPEISGPHTLDGSGTGAFTSIMTDLSPGTVYYYRAYAINSGGVSYGQSLGFATCESMLLPLIENSSSKQCYLYFSHCFSNCLWLFLYTGSYSQRCLLECQPRA
ncbi:MAG: hypothetical protein IPH88_12420, partial [Bacteroidales bacterium]|nr:hypothetical protein [Bacteroidales bacterium]